jgi:signal transduction histidine kinase
VTGRAASAGGAVVDLGSPPPQSDHVNRALAVLTGCGLLTVLVEATAVPQPLAACAAAALYALVAVLGFGWVGRRSAGHRTPLAAGYVLVQLVLGYLVFGLAGAGVGATLLLMVLVSQGFLLLPLPGAIAVTAVVPLVHVGMAWGDGLRSGLGVLGAAVFTAVVTEVLQREQRARRELAAANERLRGYAAQAEELATTQERNRVARDIHDGLGHHLTVVQMQVQAARAVLATDPGRADAVLAKAQQQSTEALAEVRRSVAALRERRAAPPLRTALEGLAAETSAAGVPTELRVDGAPRALPPESEESLFRAAQEGLTNVRKHAGATAARVLLHFGDDRVCLEVRDDGRGLPATAPDGFGLLGLRERAARIGGRLDVATAPGGGTTLLVEVPG